MKTLSEIRENYERETQKLPEFIIRGTLVDGEEYIFYDEFGNHIVINAGYETEAVGEFLLTHDIDDDEYEYESFEAERVSG